MGEIKQWCDPRIKALNCHPNFLEYFSSRLAQRLRRLLQVLDGLLELPRLGV